MKIKRGMRRWISAAMIGVFATAGLQAHEAPAAKLRAFYMSEFVVTDREGIEPYSTQLESTLLPFGIRYIVRGEKINTLEGDGAKEGMVGIELDNKERAQSWYDSRTEKSCP